MLVDDLYYIQHGCNTETQILELTEKALYIDTACPALQTLLTISSHACALPIPDSALQSYCDLDQPPETATVKSACLLKLLVTITPCLFTNYGRFSTM